MIGSTTGIIKKHTIDQFLRSEIQITAITLRPVDKLRFEISKHLRPRSDEEAAHQMQR